MKNLSEYSNDEKSLLLFFETCAVDFGGRLNSKQMNDADFEIAQKWTEEEFVRFERVASDFLPSEKCYAVFLSDEAFKIAHEERKERSKRMNLARKWFTISEKQNQL